MEEIQEMVKDVNEMMKVEKYEWEIEELKEKESQVIANGPCPTSLEGN